MNTQRYVTMALAICLIASFSQTQSSAQTVFEKTYGGSGWYYDYGRSVKQTSDGGFAIVGYTSYKTAGGYDVYLLKTDSNGILQWERRYGGPKSDKGFSVEQTSDGGYIIAGSAEQAGLSSNGPELYVIKTDHQGQVQWERAYLGNGDWDEGHCVQQTQDGGYIITGTWSFNGEKAFLLKLNSQGNEDWFQTYSGFRGYWVQPTPDGGYIITGHTVSSGQQIYSLKTDRWGNYQWHENYGKKGQGHSIEQTSDGGFAIFGYTDKSPNWGSTNYDICLIKINASGQEQWTKTFGRSNQDYGYSGQQTSDGGYILTGCTMSSTRWREVYLIKTDSSGKLEWESTFGGTRNDEGFSVIETSDSHYVVTGYKMLSDVDANVYLIKTAGPTSYQLTTSVYPPGYNCGQITVNPQKPRYSPGEKVTLTATPQNVNLYPGIYLAYWSGDASGANPTVIISMNSDKVVTANFTTCPGNRVRGDVNGDRTIDKLDVIAIINHILGFVPLTGNALCRADCDGDGSVNIMDVFRIIYSPWVLGIGPHCVPKTAISSAHIWTSEISMKGEDGFDLTLFIDASADVSGAQFSLSYDQSALTPGKPKLAGSAVEMTLDYRAENGKLTVVVHSSEGYTIPAGTKPIFTVPFKTLCSKHWTENADVHLGDIVLVASSSESIPVEIRPIRMKPETLLPEGWSLDQNYPNPFNPYTDIRYQIADSRFPLYTSLKIYNTLGQEVRTLVDEVKEAGYHTVTWDGRDNLGNPVASGVYFYCLQAGDFIASKRMMFMK